MVVRGTHRLHPSYYGAAGDSSGERAKCNNNSRRSTGSDPALPAGTGTPSSAHACSASLRLSSAIICRVSGFGSHSCILHPTLLAIPASHCIWCNSMSVEAVGASCGAAACLVTFFAATLCTGAFVGLPISFALAAHTQQHPPRSHHVCVSSEQSEHRVFPWYETHVCWQPPVRPGRPATSTLPPTTGITDGSSPCPDVCGVFACRN